MRQPGLTLDERNAYLIQAFQLFPLIACAVAACGVARADCSACVLAQMIHDAMESGSLEVRSIPPCFRMTRADAILWRLRFLSLRSWRSQRRARSGCSSSR